MNLRHSAPGLLVPSLPLSLEIQTQTLHSAQPPAYQPCWVRSHSPFSVTLACEVGLSGTKLCFRSGFFVGRAAVCTCVSTGSLASLTSAPLLKESLCGPYTAAPSPGPLLHALHLPKSMKSVLVRAGCSLPVPPRVLGNRISLWNFPGLCGS